MTPNNTSQPQDSSSKTAHRWTVLALVLVVSVISVPFIAGSVGAQTQEDEANQTEPAPYYNNSSSTNVDNESWTAGNEDATFANITAYASRIGTFVIGSDPADSNAPTGPLIVGLMVLGAGLGVTIGTGMGIVSGGVLAILALAGVSAVGIFPGWFYAVGLFGVGLLLSASFKRIVA